MAVLPASALTALSSKPSIIRIPGAGYLSRMSGGVAQNGFVIPALEVGKMRETQLDTLQHSRGLFGSVVIRERAFERFQSCAVVGDLDHGVNRQPPVGATAHSAGLETPHQIRVTLPQPAIHQREFLVREEFQSNVESQRGEDLFGVSMF